MQDLVAPSDLVSIITPAYNAERFILETVKSVQAQTHTNWEMLIVIDKASRDNTMARLESLKDPRIQILDMKNQPGSMPGVTFNRNFALKKAQGQYVAFLDSDDLWLPTKLQEQIAFMQQNGAALSCTAFRRIDETGRTQGQLLEVPLKITYQSLLQNNVIGCLTALVDIAQTGPLQMHDTQSEDYVLWLSLLKRGLTGSGLNKDLARYRIVQGSRSNNKVQMLKTRWQIMRQYENLNLLKTAYFVILYALSSFKKYKAF